MDCTCFFSRYFSSDTFSFLQKCCLTNVINSRRNGKGKVGVRIEAGGSVSVQGRGPAGRNVRGQVPPAGSLCSRVRFGIPP